LAEKVLQLQQCARSIRGRGKKARTILGNLGGGGAEGTTGHARRTKSKERKDLLKLHGAGGKMTTNP